ncbi:MAG TPA: hypothetical protein IAD08_08470 [Candidatus Scatovivens faecipullorum]|nr:hypothetical protein [Candidatus Scatovivens faecipullorum]
MEIEKVGEIFIDGRIINLDNSSMETLNSNFEEITSQKEKLINNINNILEQIQK